MRTIKIGLCVLISFLLFLSLVSGAEAKKVAMIVKDANSLSDLYERKIERILNEMGFEITLVDKNATVNYSDFDLIVVAGRPGNAYSYEKLDDFVKDIPVNDIPTIAISSQFIKDWGWVNVDDIGTLFSSQPHRIIIKATHPITQGYALDQSVQVHVVSGYSIIDLKKIETRLNIVASADSLGNYGVILYGYPNTELYNNKSISNHSAVVFFGITYPYYWTDEAVNLFKNSVNFLLNLDFTPPTTPVLSGPTSARNSFAFYQWTASNHSTGIQYYKFQLSNSPNFDTTLADINTTSLQYNITDLVDGNAYYARVKAVNWIDVSSEWSNTVKTTADFSDIIVTINSPASDSTVKVGDSVFVNATINSTRPVEFCLASIGSQTSNLTYMNETCSGNIIIPNVPGATNLTVSATNNLGTTNSSNVSITVQAPPTTTVPTGGGGGYFGYGGIVILSIEAPSSITAYENCDQEISVRVKNEGTVLAHSVKITVSGVGSEVQPSQVDLDRNKYQDFKVTLHMPAGTGEKQIILKALSYEATRTKKITLTVLPKIFTPVLRIAGVELPTFIEGEQVTVNITLENIGNATANASVSVLLPAGWSSAEPEKTFEVQPSSQIKASFVVIPSSESGQLTFNVSYLVSGHQELISKSFEVKPNPKQEMPITGMIAAVITRPEFYLLASLVVILILIRIWKKRMIKLGMLLRFSQKNMNGFNVERRKINPASSYLEWERRQRLR